MLLSLSSDSGHRHSQAHSGRYYPRNPSYRLSRDELRDFASATLETLEAGVYYPPGPDHEGSGATVESKHREDDDKDEEHPDKPKGKPPSTPKGTPYDLKTKIKWTIEHTEFYPPDDEVLASWAEADLGPTSEGEREEKQERKKTKIIIGEYSTLVGARKLHGLVHNGEGDAETRIGVLNFASAKKPGGGFINGAQAQEESIARASTLYPSLLTPTAKQFYRYYGEDPDNAFYTHAMVYSPRIVLFRSDKGAWLPPIEVDVLTSAAVNAGDVRKQVQWEDEMRELRERVRVAELSRAKAVERIRREEEATRRVWSVEVEAYEEKSKAEEKEDKQKEKEKEKAGTGETTPTQPTAQISPIIFATDPDPAPPAQPLDPATTAAPAAPTTSTSTISFNTEPEASPHPNPPSSNDDPLELADLQIASEMHERIARLLMLFHHRGARHLVLGSFGTGVFQNSIELVAGIFRDLLCGSKPDAGHGEDERGRGQSEECSNGGVFEGVFESVVFAVLGGGTVRVFRRVFEGEEGVEMDEDGEGSDVEGMKDLADVPKGKEAEAKQDGASTEREDTSTAA